MLYHQKVGVLSSSKSNSKSSGTRNASHVLKQNFVDSETLCVYRVCTLALSVVLAACVQADCYALAPDWMIERAQDPESKYKLFTLRVSNIIINHPPATQCIVVVQDAAAAEGVDVRYLAIEPVDSAWRFGLSIVGWVTLFVCAL